MWLVVLSVLCVVGFGLVAYWYDWASKRRYAEHKKRIDEIYAHHYRELDRIYAKYRVGP